jgi:DNA repair exonuclease SbcCD ATPase subunit
MNWQKVLKKANRASAHELQQAMQEIASTLEEQEKARSQVGEQIQKAQLALATGDEGEDLQKLNTQLQELDAKVAGLRIARQKLEAALPEAQARDAKKRLQQVEADIEKLRPGLDSKKAQALDHLAQASKLLAELGWGTFGEIPLAANPDHPRHLGKIEGWTQALEKAGQPQEMVRQRFDNLLREREQLKKSQ